MKIRNSIKGLVMLFVLMLIVSSCNLPAKPTPSAAESPATGTAEPSLTPNPFPSPTLVTVGNTEVVFNWNKDKCEKLDIPDLPARAFRDAEGNVQLIATHLVGRRFIGPNFSALQHECDPIMRTAGDGDPAHFNDNEWLASPYTEDGQTIYAIVHEEYHGWEHNNCNSKDNFACWYNALTLAISKDGGKTYQNAYPPPKHLIAASPHPYEAGAGPYGVFEPSNIIKRDGYYYAFARIDEYKSDAQRICLMRTNDLSDPKSWRAWDGSDFTVQFIDPYSPANQTNATTTPECAAMDGNLGIMDSSITFNTYLNKYVMVGTTAVHVNGKEVWGVLYAFSADLIKWEPRQLLFEVPLPWTFQKGEPNVYLYPSLIDPDSTSRNFETTGKKAYLYLTRFNHYSVGDPLDRDLIRIPVEFFPSQDKALKAEVPFLP